VIPDQVFSIVRHVPVIGGCGALLFLTWGVLRRNVDITLAALSTFVVVGVVAVPVFLLGDRHDAAIAAMVGLEAAAAVALAALFVWFTTRRYPAFPATAALILGILAGVLVVRAAVM